MNDDLFNDLLSSASEAASIARAEAHVGRVSTYRGHVLVEVRDGDTVLWTLHGAAETLASRLPVASIPLVNPSPKFIREALRQTQEGFAQLLGCSVETIRSWEQGRREPKGPARKLLDVAARAPLAIVGEYTDDVSDYTACT